MNLLDEILGQAELGNPVMEKLALGLIEAQRDGREIQEVLPDFSKVRRNEYFTRLSNVYLSKAHSLLKGSSWDRSGQLSHRIKLFNRRRFPRLGDALPEDEVDMLIYQAMQFGRSLPESQTRIHEIIGKFEEQENNARVI